MRRTYLLDALVLCADSPVQSNALLTLEQIGERESDDEGVDKEEQHSSMSPTSYLQMRSLSPFAMVMQFAGKGRGQHLVNANFKL